MDQLLKQGEEKKPMNARIRRRKNPSPQPSPTNSIQDLLRRLPPKNNVVQIETTAPSNVNPTNLGKRKAVAEVEEHNTRAKVAKRADQKKRMETRRADLTNDHLLPELAEKFRTRIRELGFSGEPTLVIQKRLFQTDVERNHQRLAMPESQIKNKELLSKMERELRKPGGMKATLIDDRLKEWEDVNFGKWKSNAQYAIKSPWNEIVRENELKIDKLIQVWTFTMDNKLFFILVQ